VRRALPLVGVFFLSAGAIASCGQRDEVDRDEFFSNMVVPVGDDFDQSDAEGILEECNATDGSIVLLNDGTARFEPTSGMSVNGAACVLDRLMTSGRPNFEHPGLPAPVPIGPEPRPAAAGKPAN
jgi:hypothetical protein